MDDERCAKIDTVRLLVDISNYFTLLSTYHILNPNLGCLSKKVWQMNLFSTQMYIHVMGYLLKNAITKFFNDFHNNCIFQFMNT